MSDDVASVRSVERSWFTGDYSIKTVPEAFSQDVYTPGWLSSHSVDSYDAIDDAVPVEGSLMREDNGSGWSSDPFTQTCDGWTLELADTTVSVSQTLSNSLASDITQDITYDCQYETCSNTVAET